MRTKTKHAAKRFSVQCDDPYCEDHNWDVLAQSAESAFAKVVDPKEYEPLALRGVGGVRLKISYPLSNGGHPITVRRIGWDWSA